MKTKIIPIITGLTLLSIIFSSCEDSTYKEYTGNAPVYMSYEDLRAAVAEEPGIDLTNPGKIYFKDNYIFIVEELKGIHVYDNTDPSSPVKKSFVTLPGVIDISISGYIMYADSYIDLVVLDVQNIDNIHEVGRIKDIFPYMVPPVDNDYPTGPVDDKKGVVIEWEVKKIREKVDYVPNPYPFFGLMDGVKFSSQISGYSQGVSGSGVGIGGSMARFGIHDKVLYVLNESSLKVFDITSKTSPVMHNDFYPGWGIETMFLTDKTMFLGTTTGMIIYDISNPLSPQSQGRFNHARSCDPVVVDDTLAYITLRTGTNCGGATNTLDVVNIKNLSNPKLVMTYPMTNPHGLGKDGNLLFICDGSAGLKVYDASDAKTISSHLIYTYPNINAFDVIPIGSILILIGDDGLYQYSYANVQNLSLLSKISVSGK